MKIIKKKKETVQHERDERERKSERGVKQMFMPIERWKKAKS